MDEKQEFGLRRNAMRWRLKGTAHEVILARVHRSRAWLSKWQKRFDQHGISGLHGHSRRPHRIPTKYSSSVVKLIVQTRCRLVKQKVGLIGARAIRRELRKVSGNTCLPSLSTIKRVLRRRGVIARPSQSTRVYFPKPLQVVSGRLHALDPLPITAGWIHFIRQVRSDGTITILNEPWKVSKRLAGKYVWATLITHCRRLEIWYQRSAQHPWRLLKNCAYNISETVARSKPEFTHFTKA